MTSSSGRRRWIWVVAVFVVLVAVAVVLVFFVFKGAPAASQVTPTSSVSASPTPTHTTPPSSRPPTPTPTPTTTPTSAPTPTPTPTGAVPVTQVTPFVSYAGWDATAQAISVSASVQQIVEADGRCTITATSGSAVVSATFDATPSASTTDCGSHDLSSPQLTSGSWSVVVAYTSSTSSGTSAASEVTVP